MTPDASLVHDLEAYDPKLRIRWAKHVEKWFIERKLDQRNPQLVSEQPLPESRQGLQRDLWEGWQEGYIHVLTVPLEMAHWTLIAPELARADSWRQGGWAGVNKQLDDEAVALDKKEDKRIDNWSENATDDAYEHLAWFQGRRVAMDGFTVVDRRRA